MLDLDFLAEQQAHSLQQDQASWRQAVWNADFQKLTQSMTDGEVEIFISICASVPQFEIFVAQVKNACAKSSLTPFAALKNAAHGAGIDVERSGRSAGKQKDQI